MKEPYFVSYMDKGWWDRFILLVMTEIPLEEIAIELKTSIYRVNCGCDQLRKLGIEFPRRRSGPRSGKEQTKFIISVDWLRELVAEQEKKKNDNTGFFRTVESDTSSCDPEDRSA